jgi:hypothetical protein
MPISRRAFIRVIGASAVVAATGTTGFLLTRTPTRAQEPWHIAGTVETEPRRRALSYAILAPNPHNRQPWMVDLTGDDELVLYCDPERVLPETDPYNRQITIGLGCFLELLRMAAAQDGYRAEISPFPEGHSAEALDGRPIARVKLTADATVASDPLFAAVLERRSNKEPFDIERPVSQASLDALRAANSDSTGLRVATANDDETVALLRDLTWRAFEIEIKTPATYMESVRLMRIGKSEIEANPDGIDLGGPFLETLKLVGALSRESLADMESSAYQQGLDMYRDITGTAMGYVWIATSSNTRLDQLAAGAAYLRLNLKAAAVGVDMHPLSQALQEYPQMSGPYEEIHTNLAQTPNEYVQMLARVGYGPEVQPSPRWAAQSRIKNA